MGEAHAGGTRRRSVRDPARDDYQRALVAAYQEALASVGGDRGAVPERGRQALVELLADVDLLLRKTARDAIAHRFAGRMPAGLFEEVFGEAQVATLKAVAEYDGRKAFASWLVARNGGPAWTAIRDTINARSRDSDLNQAEDRAVGYARRAWSDLLATGIDPTPEEVTDLARQRCMAWATRKVHDAWARQGRVPGDGPDTSPEAEQAAARAKLVKAGTWKALGQLWDLLALADPAVLYDPTTPSVVDRPTDPAPDRSGELDSPVAQVATCGMPATDTETILEHLFRDEQDDSVKQDAATARQAKAYLAELLAAAQGRLRAPHAHFAALSPTLDAQFETTAGPAGPGAALAAARSDLL